MQVSPIPIESLKVDFPISIPVKRTVNGIESFGAITIGVAKPITSKFSLANFNLSSFIKISEVELSLIAQNVLSTTSPNSSKPKSTKLGLIVNFGA